MATPIPNTNNVATVDFRDILDRIKWTTSTTKRNNNIQH